MASTPALAAAMNTFLGDLRGNSSNNTTLTIKSSPPKTAAVATRLGVRTGVLTKRNEQQVWQRRYCALVPQTLLYYYDGEHSESARGIIDLEYYTEVEVVARNTIRLSTPPDIPLRSFFFKADDEDQCAAWAAALTRERYFVVADERDAYQRLQAEFQKQSSESADSCDRLREETAQRRRACEAAALRLGDALAQLRQQAVSLGLSESSAASLREPRDAVREVAHRLHYHMRRAAHLGDAVAGAADQETSGGGAGPSDEERLRTLDDLRERVAAAKRARQREETARLASEGTRADKAAALDDAQRRVGDEAKSRVAAETKAAELADQKRILVREVKQTRKRAADAKALGAELEARKELGTLGLGLDDLEVDEETHRELALKRAGLARDTSSDGGGSDSCSLDGDLAAHARKNSSDRLDDLLRRATSQARDAERPKPPPPRPPAGASPFAKVCRRCGGTVEGPRNSTCKCAAPQID